jgi:glycosyltransferase involved in cell wall biosynthesis
LLFFGRIQPYKGLEHLVEALEILQASGSGEYQLIIAGEPKKEHASYWEELQTRIDNGPLRRWVLQRIQFIPDEETEIYFKAADALVLPYRGIYQSGVLFLGYSFGLPVIATDVGTFPQEVISGETGFVCRREDPGDLARAIADYFISPLYLDLDNRRLLIQSRARTSNSWDVVAAKTVEVYRELQARG